MSRPVVREALKRLTAAGLVEVRQGDATTVRDYKRHAGLDLLPRLLLRGGDRGDELDVAVVRSILETRLHNGPKVAELAAARAACRRPACSRPPWTRSPPKRIQRNVNARR